MRIAYVSADRGIPVFGEKGASIHIQEMMRAFASLGHEVRGLASRRGEGQGLSVEEVPMTSFGLDRAQKEYAAMAQASAIEARLLDLYHDWPFDLIYERFSLWSGAGCRAGKKLRVPVAVEVNAPLVAEQANYRDLVCEDEARAIEDEVIRDASVLLAVSREIAEYLQLQGAEKAGVHVVGNAVNTRRFHPLVEPENFPSITSDAFVVGFTGSLKSWHGVDTLMHAFKLLRGSVPQAHLLICGDGPMMNWVQGFVAGTGLENAVTLTGWVDHECLPGLIARMDVATAPYPASDAHYFSPLKLYEYLAMGRPLVASDIGQTSELLNGSTAAVLLEPGDAEALATTLADLSRDHARLEKMSKAAAAEGKRHDWTGNAQRVLEVVSMEMAGA